MNLIGLSVGEPYPPYTPLTRDETKEIDLLTRDQVRLTITAPEDARAIADALFEPFVAAS